jgi:hypothetical protein
VASAAIAGTKISPDFWPVKMLLPLALALRQAFIPTSSHMFQRMAFMLSLPRIMYALATNGAGRFFVDSSGRLLWCASTSRSNWANFGAEQILIFQIETSGNTRASITRTSANEFLGHSFRLENQMALRIKLCLATTNLVKSALWVLMDLNLFPQLLLPPQSDGYPGR